MVEFELLLDQGIAEDTRKISECFLDYDNADIQSIVNSLSYHPFSSEFWSADSADNVCFSDSVNDVWHKFLAPLSKAIDDHVPVKTFQKRNTNLRKAKRYPRHIRRALSKKLKYWKLFKRSGSVEDKACYNCQADVCKKLIFDFERSKEQQIILKSSLGAFYRYINRKLHLSSGVGVLKTASGVAVADDFAKATLLNGYFSSVFTHDDGKLPEFRSRVLSDVQLENIEFTPARVSKAIRQMKNKHSLDPSGFPSIFVKKVSCPLIKPLCVLFNFVFNSGDVPDDWRAANIIPIFKKGSSANCNSYRPISLTSVFCKLFERIVKEQILDYLYKNSLISRHQHGFLSKSSTCTQLLESVNDWSLAVTNRRLVDVVYFDFSRAFDSVSHPKLIHKLSAYGLTGRLLNIIAAFLSNRRQRVIIGNDSSAFVPVTSGVPQGSVLGPLLFLLFINDVVDLFEGVINVKLFADDIKIYLEIENDESVDRLQKAINDLCIWAKTWQLSLSVDKCLHLRAGLCKSVSNATYFLQEKPLKSVNETRDLGVVVDSRLSFKSHINVIVAKAHTRARQILRSFLSRDTETLLKAFNTYVRPLLEYCTPVWSPCTAGLVKRLESVQRVFTKKLPNMSKLSYEERLSALNLESLELRRTKADLLMCYKILKGFTNIIPDDFFTLLSSSTRGHSMKLYYPTSRVNVRLHFFTNRVIHMWNKLPEEVVSADSLTIFVSQLNSLPLSFFGVSF
jgi:hypothetical protein